MVEPVEQLRGHGAQGSERLSQFVGQRFAFQALCQRRSGTGGIANGEKIGRTRTIERDARYRSLKIGHATQESAHRISYAVPGKQPRHGIQPRVDGGGIGQRRTQTGSEKPRACARKRAIHRVEQRALARAVRTALDLQARPRRGIDQHVCVGAFSHGRAQRRSVGLLRRFHIADRARHGRQLGAREFAECLQRRDAERTRNPVRRGRSVEAGGILRLHGHGGRIEERAQLRVGPHTLGHDQLGRRARGDLGAEPLERYGGDAERAGRDIDGGEREGVLSRRAHAGESDERVGRGRVKQPFLGDRAGRDETHDITPHDRFRAALLGLGRVLKLLADGDAVAQCDQFLQIVVGGRHRHAAHRNVLAQVLAALGEMDAQAPGRFDRIVEEQLVEVAHAIEQQTIRVGGPDLDILLHHGRRLCGDRTSMAVRFHGRGVLHARHARAVHRFVLHAGGR